MVTDAVGSAISGSCANTFKKFIFHNSDLFQEDRSLCVSEAATVCLSTRNLASCIGKLHIVFSLAAARSRTLSRFIAFFPVSVVRLAKRTAVSADEATRYARV